MFIYLNNFIIFKSQDYIIFKKVFMQQPQSFIFPITCDITIDGISGLKYGNLFTVDELSDFHKNNMVFFIIRLTENINNGK